MLQAITVDQLLNAIARDPRPDWTRHQRAGIVLAMKISSPLRPFRAGGIAVLWGLVLGLAIRVAMRFVALEAGMSPGFSTGGSLEVVGFGALVGAPIAMVFFLLRPKIGVRGPGPGLLVGLTMFAAFALLPPPSARSALAATSDSPSATAALFGGVLAAWGLGSEYLHRRFLARSVIDSPEARADSMIGASARRTNLAPAR